MSPCSNSTSPGAHTPLEKFLCPPELPFAVIGAMLLISLSVNIFFCVSKCRSGKETRQRQSPRQMEDNPIYGNVMYKTYTSLLTDADPPHSSFSSSSVTDQQRITSNAQYTPQDCYANLSLKPPRPQSGRSSPLMQSSDVVQSEASPEAEKEDEGNTDTSANTSDLYASVQTQRTKTVDTTDTGESMDYANHL
ncbi:hypothetical protein JOB18_037764 [Solea senegalensis]|uniref:Uncharacterized protein n=1 Tax=Solea senegalensis TaxID=28829 RepID=A0AAV6QRN2_SOLSE|nr:hypothetical protein JOB18_037764 [Solea senegalensis]